MSMSTLESYLPVGLPLAGATSGDRREDPIADCVEQALSAAHPLRSGKERRRETRYPYPYPIYLTPITDSGILSPHTIPVIGKQISPHGVDFYHREPLPYRRVIASLDCAEHGWIGLLLELAWCRFSRHGWYDNGGRFLSVVESPFDGWRE